jgi:hypothetical protein
MVFLQDCENAEPANGSDPELTGKSVYFFIKDIATLPSPKGAFNGSPWSLSVAVALYPCNDTTSIGWLAVNVAIPEYNLPSSLGGAAITIRVQVMGLV